MRPLARPLSVLGAVLVAFLLSCDDGTDTPAGVDGGGAKEICDNGKDDDGDRKADCADPDCLSALRCSAVEDCSNGSDDDEDGLADCDDSDCSVEPHCEVVLVEDCANGRDDDGDGDVDCKDADCSTQLRCKAEDCKNGKDDNGNGKIDCGEASCESQPCGTGCKCQGGGPTESACGDGDDNDGDTLADCEDVDCPPCPGREDCTNNRDDDGDGSADCADSDCTSCGQFCSCSGGRKVETNCVDTVDNDGDGQVSCADSDCIGKPGCLAEDCDNGSDDDGDGDADCADANCQGKQCKPTPGCVCNGLKKTEDNCGDGQDNDDDGKTDCPDPDCSGKGACAAEDCTNGRDDNGNGLVDCAEATCAGQFCKSDQSCKCVGTKKTELACGDGTDNDGDTLSDCADSDCTATPACTSTENCTNGVDDDGDRAIDCKDSNCAGNSGCTALADGKPCSADSQCKGGLCQQEAAWGTPNGFCSARCTTPGSTCAGGGICIFADATTGFCRPKCTCSGTNCSNNGGCRAGYACMTGSVNYTNPSAPSASFCVAQCSSTSECSELPCNLYSNYCEADRGLKKHGQPCASDDDCESYFCLTASSDGFPGGYCFGFCNTSTKVCGGDAYCYALGSTDGLGDCYDGCAAASECRTGESYSCLSADTGKICYPTCGVVGATCSSTSPCCAGHTCSSGTCQ